MTNAQARASALGLAFLLGLRVALGVFVVHTLWEVAQQLQERGASAMVVYGTVAWEPLVVVALVVASSLHGLPLVARQLISTGRLHLWVRRHAVATSPGLAAITDSRAPAVRVVEVAGVRPLAFTLGLVRPYIVLSSPVVRLMSPEEIAAVVLHEASHARNLDPLRVMASRALADFWRWCPCLIDWADRHVVRCELVADQHAMHHVGAQPLIAALNKLNSDTPAMAGAVAGLQAEALNARLSQLEFGRQPGLRRSSPMRVWISIAAIATIATLCVLSLGFYGHQGLSLLFHGG